MRDDKLILHEDYNDCLVAFVDILGFSKRVKAINNNDTQTFIPIAETIHNLKDVAKIVDADSTLYSEFNATFISDSMILSVPYNSPDKLLLMILLLHSIQFEMLFNIERTLIRGLVVKGPVYHKGGIIFGSGYMDAYEGEKLIGHAPRIVISPEITNSLQYELMYLNKDDTDNLYYIDYFKPISKSPSKHNIDKRQQISNFINMMLDKYSTDNNVFPKYEWLHSYFNSSAHYFD